MAILDLKSVRYILLGFTCLITSCTATLDEKYRNKLYTMSEVPIAKIPISPPLEKRTIMTPGRNLLHNTAKKQEYFSGINERKKMYMLEGKKSSNPQKNKKNKQRVQEEYKKLYAKREQRIGWKIDFLQSFYRDLYLLQPEKFNKKYKRHCSDELSSTLKTLYKQRHNGLKGNYWYLFGDNAIHRQEEIKIANIKYADHDKEGIKEYHSFMYGDKRSWKRDSIPYSDSDPWWYQVQLGTNTIMIQLIGMNKFVIITGLINPELQIAINDPY